MVDAVVMTDVVGRIVYFDAGAEALFGYQGQDVTGGPVDILVPTRLRDAHWSGFHRAMEDPTVKDMAADMPVLCADGEIREYAGRLLALSNGLGTAVGAIAIYSDERSTGIRPFREPEDH
ncbi:PAS domain-containing protein [Microbacterium pygmaeum]|uniref:PAS domain S-box-containing protein n=1 Tax=Microbacterium pygmaeum TaxID=370764 RepID=A0A1G7Y3C3_9MICO|nr:PAS domain-containing protein [Microbacterium pygmaeum]SDG90914.1 PAS domain S-box-containing protein [Microbacterium pygmaeum]